MVDASLAALGLRLAVSMAVVIALMFLAAKLLKKAQVYAANSGTTARRGERVTRTPISVDTITPLTRGASVAIVRAGGRELVVGITEQQVTLLHAGDEAIDAVDRPDARVTSTSLDLDGAGTDAAPITKTPRTARIAALAPSSTQTATAGADGASAWTDALETLRGMTVRR